MSARGPKFTKAQAAIVQTLTMEVQDKVKPEHWKMIMDVLDENRLLADENKMLRTQLGHKPPAPPLPKADNKAPLTVQAKTQTSPPASAGKKSSVNDPKHKNKSEVPPVLL